MAMLKLTMVVHVDEDEVDSIVDQPAGLFLVHDAYLRHSGYSPEYLVFDQVERLD